MDSLTLLTPGLFTMTAPVSVGTSLTDLLLLTFKLPLRYFLLFEVENGGSGQTTDSFIMQRQDHPDGELYNWLGGADFDSTNIPSMIFCTTTGPHELPTANRAHVTLAVDCPYRIKFRAKVGTGTTPITVRGLAARP